METREDGKPIKSKSRDILYAGHLDNFIYKHYGDLLNKEYNKWALDKNIDEQSIAYRDNKQGKSNIDFAAEIMNDICQLQHCFILVGDFEKYFDSLDHYYLKERVKEVLKTDYLEEDWYKVLSSVTKYSYYEKDLLNRQLGTDREIRMKKLKMCVGAWHPHNLDTIQNCFGARHS